MILRTDLESEGSTLSKSGRICRWLLGAIFILAAILKTLSFADFAAQVSYYNIVRDAFWVRLTAMLVIGGEVALGFTLWFWKPPKSRGVLALTFCIILIFSILILYGWILRDLENCACFGKYLKLTPGWSLVKNALLCVIILIAWIERRESPALKEWTLTKTDWIKAGLCVLLSSCMVLLVFLFTPALSPSPQNSQTRHLVKGPEKGNSPSPIKQGKYANFSIQDGNTTLYLGKGAYFIALLSDSCENCGATVQELNKRQANDDLPPTVAFVLGDAGNLHIFREEYQPQFPVASMEVLDFLERIGESPPRFALIKDGNIQCHWDGKLPEAVMVLEATLLL